MGRLRETSSSVRGTSAELDAAFEEPVTEARRHRVVSELRLDPGSGLAVVESGARMDASSQATHESGETPRDAFDSDPFVSPSELERALGLADVEYLHRRASTPLASGVLTDDLRASLWDVIRFFLFARAGEGEGEGEPERDVAESDDLWAMPTLERPAVRRVWSAPPISGDPTKIPEDVSKLLEGWFSLVEPGDVYAFAETVHESLEPAQQPRFAGACNAALERGLSDHRFVVRRLVPIASKVDITTIERALAICTARGLSAGIALEDAIAHLGMEPESDGRSAIQEAVRAVELAAFALTGERYLTLEEVLEDLKARGIVDGAVEAAHRGLFAFADGGSGQQTTADGARRVLVMCAGFVTYLATRS